MIRAMRKLRHSDRRGATSVEFAICAQVIFVLIFGMIEFSRLNMMRNLAQDAAYYAARKAMVPGATVGEATATANQILGYLGTQSAAIVINDGGALDENSDEIKVKITIPMQDNALFTGGLLGGMDIVATATMRTERYDGYYQP